MGCYLKIDDVPTSQRANFARGVHFGVDIARRGGDVAEARKIIYAGLNEPHSSEQFWHFHGAVAGIHGENDVPTTRDSSD